MPQTVHAWLEDEDRSGAATGLAAIADDLINTSGDNLRLRADLRKIAMMYFWTEFAAYPPVLVTIEAASIRQNPIRLTKGVALNYISEGQIYDLRNTPLPLIRAGDDVKATGYEADEAGVAHYTGVALIVSNAPIPIVAPVPMNHIHRCTVGAATAGAWSKLSLTEQDPLPPGDYYMMGARVESATAFAARFMFKGLEVRPAVIPCTRSQDLVHPFSRFWGKPIKFTMPDGLPKLELLACAAETAGDVTLYLHNPAVKSEGVGRG